MLQQRIVVYCDECGWEWIPMWGEECPQWCPECERRRLEKLDKDITELVRKVVVEEPKREATP